MIRLLALICLLSASSVAAETITAQAVIVHVAPEKTAQRNNASQVATPPVSQATAQQTPSVAVFDACHALTEPPASGSPSVPIYAGADWTMRIVPLLNGVAQNYSGMQVEMSDSSIPLITTITTVLDSRWEIFNESFRPVSSISETVFPPTARESLSLPYISLSADTSVHGTFIVEHSIGYFQWLVTDTRTYNLTPSFALAADGITISMTASQTGMLDVNNLRLAFHIINPGTGLTAGYLKIPVDVVRTVTRLL